VSPSLVSLSSLFSSLYWFVFSDGVLTQERLESILKLEVAGRPGSGVLRGHLAKRLAIRSWVGAGLVVVIVSIPEHLEFLSVGSIPDTVVVVRVPSSTATLLSLSSFASGHL
jgi:hypothetical protein